jgi:hypothetical protein
MQFVGIFDVRSSEKIFNLILVKDDLEIPIFIKKLLQIGYGKMHS